MIWGQPSSAILDSILQIDHGAFELIELKPRLFFIFIIKTAMNAFLKMGFLLTTCSI
jgi:hypothetical protein